MLSCTHCDRHFVKGEAFCPFCHSKQRLPLSERALQLCMGGLTTMVLAACYGPPAGPIDTSSLGPDADADGWNAPDDCDDEDPARNPGEVEICDDDIDNDCDFLVDEDDDDCDVDDTGDTGK